MQEMNRFHHVGFAVRSLADTQVALEALGANFLRETVDEERNLDFRFAEWGGVLIELVSPHDPAVFCVVTKMVEKQPCTPYHVCLEVSDLEYEIERLKGRQFRRMGQVLTTDIYGYESSGVFMYNKDVGVVELVERSRREQLER